MMMHALVLILAIVGVFMVAYGIMRLWMWLINFD